LNDLLACVSNPEFLLRYRIKELLEAGDADTYSAMWFLRMDHCEKGWLDALNDAYKSCPLWTEEDDIPF
jgi:hypothetical protein